MAPLQVSGLLAPHWNRPRLGWYSAERAAFEPPKGRPSSTVFEPRCGRRRPMDPARPASQQVTRQCARTPPPEAEPSAPRVAGAARGLPAMGEERRLGCQCGVAERPRGPTVRPEGPPALLGTPRQVLLPRLEPDLGGRDNRGRYPGLRSSPHGREEAGPQRGGHHDRRAWAPAASRQRGQRGHVLAAARRHRPGPRRPRGAHCSHPSRPGPGPRPGQCLVVEPCRPRAPAVRGMAQP